MQIVDGIHKFETGPFNWYVIEESGRLTVVDAGFPGHYRTFLRGIKSMGKTVKDVEAIIITHAHADHTGFAERLRNASGAPVYVHKDDKRSIQRVLQLPWAGLLGNAWRMNVRGMLEHATLHGVFRMARVKEVVTFTDDEVLDVPGQPQVIHTPGHTLGETAFLLPNRNVLFSGDTLVTQDLLTGQHGVPQVPHRSLSTNDKQARRSIDRLHELGRVTMLPGHGKPWNGTMKDAVELARSRFVRQSS